MSVAEPPITPANGRAHIEPAPYLLERGFPDWAIVEAGWRVEQLGPRHARYGLPPEAAEAEVWCIPYLHPNGHVWFERVRLTRAEDLERFAGGKYRQPAGVKLALYDPYLVLGLENFEPLDSVLLIEGEANTVAMHALMPELKVIGLPGQSALTPAMASQLGAIPVIFLWIDRHDPGADENARRIAERLKEAGVDEVRQLPQPPGRIDANDMLREAPAQSRQLILEMIDAAQEVELTSVDENWPALPRPVPPPFPVDALGDELGAFVTALATQTQTAPDLAALAVLGALSSVALAAKINCGNWDEETLGLYILAVSPSGDRKSTVLKKVAAPLYRIENDDRERSKAKKLEHDARLELLQARKQEITRRARKLEDEDDWAAAQAELEHVTSELAEAAEFIEPRLLTDDTTPEGLAELLARHNTGIAVLSAESAVIDNLLGHYSDKGKANLHVVCKAYNAERASVDRRGTPALIIPRPLLGITLFAQPFVLENVLAHTTARGQGLIGRFVLVDASTASYVGHRQIDPPPPAVPGYLHEAWDRIVQRVKGACNATEPTQPGFVGSVAPGDVQLLTLTLSPSSKKSLTELEVKVEPRQADGADLATYRDWVSRHHGRIARIAGLLHLAEREPEQPIAIDTMQRALRIGDYILEHGLLALSAPDERQRRALSWLSRQEEHIVSRRDIHYGVLGGHGKVDRATQLGEALVDAGALRPIIGDDEPPNPKGGRPKGPRYEINPHLRAR